MVAQIIFNYVIGGNCILLFIDGSQDKRVLTKAH